jgi:hypothetical protein
MKILNTQYGVTGNYIIANRCTSKDQFKKLVTSFVRTVEKFLSLRPVILGGIREIDCFSELFDEQFLYGEVGIDQDINKIIDTLVGDAHKDYSKGLYV